MSPISDEELEEQVRALRRENDERERRESSGLPLEGSNGSSKWLDDAIDYILDNMAKVPRPQLDASLRKAGHSPEAIEGIWLGVEEAMMDKAFVNGPQIVVRAYPGRTQVEAGDLFEREAAHAAQFGYSPISQSWSEGRPGVGRVLMIGVASLVIRPKGFLTVTYARNAPPLHTEIAATAVATKTCPMCAEDVKAAARICRFCRYEFEGS